MSSIKYAHHDRVYVILILFLPTDGNAFDDAVVCVCVCVSV
jgi:hypothetical protein